MRSRLPTRLLVLAVAVATGAAAPVPSPVHVQPGAAAATGVVAWVPAVQHVTGGVGETVAVDLALDDGTEAGVVADLAVRAVEVDPVEGPRLAGASSALTVAIDRIVLGPGDRGAFRAVAEIPSVTTLVAVEARLERDDDARPAALVLVGPAGEHAELSPGIDLAGGDATVRIRNGSDFPALVDLAVTSATWLGPADDIQVTDVLVPAAGERVLPLELSRGLGRRSAAVAVLPRGADPDATVRADTAAWPARTSWVLVGAALIAVVGAAGVRALRRS